ncbi:MAG: Clp protease N-terminal domain-containing protein [Ruthenibacterium lactatiformans]
MNYTFSGFSKAGNAVVRGAIAAAQDMGHTYVGTEHLLLALARDDTGEAAAFLLERQVYGYQVGRLLREQVGCGRRTRLSPRDFTPALSKCVDCAVIEAKAVSDGKVEPVHLLAALLEAPATAGRILVQLGVEPAAAAKECGRRMGKFPLFQQTPRPVTSPRGAARAAEKWQGPDEPAEQDKLDPCWAATANCCAWADSGAAAQNNPGGRAGRGQDGCGGRAGPAHRLGRNRPSSGQRILRWFQPCDGHQVPGRF